MFTSFFTKQVITATSPIVQKKVPTSSTKSIKTYTCADCGLDMQCMHPRLNEHVEADLVVVFDNPSPETDKLGIVNIGEVESYVKECLASKGITGYTTLYAAECSVNSSGDTKTKSRIEKASICCNQRLQKTLDYVNPLVIITVGGVASKAILGDWVKGFSASNIAGMRFPYHPRKAWVYPLIDVTPKVLKQPQLKNLIRKDIESIDFQKEAPQYPQWQKEIDTIYEFNSIISYLEGLVEEINDNDCYLVFDYEATSLRPFVEGAKIACVALSIVYSDYTYTPTTVIPLEHNILSTAQQQVVLDAFYCVLSHPNIQLVAQNAPFEDAYTRWRIKQAPLNWFWCTMNGEHLLDERPNITGLKFQLTRHYGLYGYDDEMHYYIRAQGDEVLNRVMSAPIDRLFLYCGLDVVGTRNRFIDQYTIMANDPPLMNCMELFMAGIRCFCDLHDRGFDIATEYYKEQQQALRVVCNEIEKDIQNDPDVCAFKRTSFATNGQFSSTSGKDISALFFDYLKYEPFKSTIGGAASTDKHSLEQIDHPVAKAILHKRSKEKLETTYLTQFLREQCDSRLYPIYQLHTTETGRSSCTNPNFQNIPKRDKVAQEICRRGIICPPGFRIFEIDYSGIEVKACAMYTKDPVLLQYLNDDTSDMHYDLSQQVFLLPRERVTKSMRSIGKNKATFPWFYGSYFVSIASNLWDTILHDNLTTADGILLKDHIFKQTIMIDHPKTGKTVRIKLDCLEHYEEHIKAVEKDFWNRFTVFKEWQDTQCARYDRELVTENFFGFRRRRDLSKNMIINTPFQGTAFQCLLWSLIRCNNEMVKRGYKSYLTGQIHDAINGYVHPSEEQEVFSLLEQIMCHDLVDAHPWIIIPMDVELDVSAVNGNWYELKTWAKTNGVWHPK